MRIHTHIQDWPVDAHFHGRHPNDPRFGLIRFVLKDFEYAVWMPNLAGEAIRSATNVAWYLNAISRKANELGLKGHKPLIAVKATHATTPAQLHAAFDAGAIALKFYPVDANCGEGMTTNASGGVSDFFDRGIQDLYRVCTERKRPILLHGEVPDKSVAEEDREWRFDPVLCRIADENPDLRIVFEHISDRRMVNRIKDLPDNVVATITLHHLLNTGEDNVNPHNKCMPTAKTSADRDALIEAALSGNPKFFFGSDSAPHLRDSKENPLEGKDPANGVFSSPVAMSELIGLFLRRESLAKLNDFTSTFARGFYKLPSATKQVSYARQPYRVAQDYDDVVPLKADNITWWSRLND